MAPVNDDAPTLPYAIRPGTPGDLDAVFALVRELAAYERAADQVATTAETYRADLAAGWFDLLIAEEAGGRVLGMMLYHRAYSTWKGRMTYLEDFVVAVEGCLGEERGEGFCGGGHGER